MSKEVFISFLGMHLVNSQVCNIGQEVWILEIKNAKSANILSSQEGPDEDSLLWDEQSSPKVATEFSEELAASNFGV